MLILQVPIYIVAQLLGSVLASGSLYLIFDVKDEAFFGTIPVGTNVQSFVLEIIISFLLMFVISGVATDNRSVSQQSTLILFSLILKKKIIHILLMFPWQIGELAGIAIGMTILLNVLVAGYPNSYVYVVQLIKLLSESKEIFLTKFS